MLTWRVLVGDVREQLATLEAKSVHTIVTSPPYWGLRDYGAAGQIGLEATPAAYVATLVDVFRAARRVLRDDGVLWLNLGDSYSGAGNGGQGANGALATRTAAIKSGNGLKPKDLCGIPWRAAFALQADGWYLRADVIWAKPNPMPESVTDRPTKAHEYVFLLSKRERYFYDAQAIAEHACEPAPRTSWPDRKAAGEPLRQGVIAYSRAGLHSGGLGGDGVSRNARSVWTITTDPYPEAHFATFPEALPARCIQASSSAHGACPACGAPWQRLVMRERMIVQPSAKRAGWQAHDDHARTQIGGTMTRPPRADTVGWAPACCCAAGDPVPCVVLDPFCGSGTTGYAALRLGRSFVGIELKPAYAALARARLGSAGPLFAQEVTTDPRQVAFAL